MVLKTLYSGVDYEAFSNTNSTDVDNYLDFTVDRIHSYNALAYKNTETYVTWDGPNLTIFPTDYFFKGNVLTFRGPISIPNVDTSSFMMKNEIPNLMGNYFITIWYDDNGDIEYLETEPMIFTNEDVTYRDFENPKKFIKSKIKIEF